MVCYRKCEIPGMRRGSGFRLERDSGELQGRAFVSYENRVEKSDPLVWNEVINSAETRSSFLDNKNQCFVDRKTGNNKLV